MKKILVILFQILISVITYSQNLKERIQGQWVCEKVIDSKGNTFGNEFMPTGYLRYSFTKNKVTMSDTPFNVGGSLIVDYNGEDSFEIYHEKVKNTYSVKLLDNNNLILTVVDDGKLLDLIFKKLKSSPNGIPIDNGLIVIEHYKKSQKEKVHMRSYDYVYNDTVKWKVSNKYIRQSPTFNDYKFGYFGDFLTENFTFPKDYQLNRFSDELIVDFDITNNRVSNIKIIRGLRKDIDDSVIRLIRHTTRSWSMSEFDNTSPNLTLRFRLRFLLGLADRNSIWD